MTKQVDRVSGKSLALGWKRFKEFFERIPTGTPTHLTMVLEFSKLSEEEWRGCIIEDAQEQYERMGGQDV